MSIMKSFSPFALFAGVCAAQTISISGVVRDSAGGAIEGAVVELEKAGISTTSKVDGSFALAGDAATKDARLGLRVCSNAAPRVANGRLVITLEEGSLVEIGAYTVGGRKVYGSAERMQAGSHSVRIGRSRSAIRLYRIKTNRNEYSLKGILTETVTGGMLVANSETGTQAGAAKRRGLAEAIDDVIAATKQGWLKYRVRMTNSDTTGVEIEMIPSAGTVTDADGNVYQTVRIGTQVWTAENLRTTKLNDGTEIAEVIEADSWRGRTTAAYCYRPSTATSADTVKNGALYNWYAIETGKLGPAGWHVPSAGDWDSLQNYLIRNGYNWDGSTTGNKIAKSMAAKADWEPSLVLEAGDVDHEMWKNNSSGFSGIASGLRMAQSGPYGIDFSELGHYAEWWSSTEGSQGYARERKILRGYEDVRSEGWPKYAGLSVRLVKD